MKLPRLPRLHLPRPHFPHRRYPKSFRGRWQELCLWVKRHPRRSAAATLCLLGLTTGCFLILRDLPSPTKLRSNAYPVSTQIFDRYGQLLYEIYADTHRTPIALNSLPAYVYQASISIEDRDFYHHFGFSIQGIIRAFKNTVFNNRLQGGSTITQQLVKTALLTPERTFQRKFREAVLTVGTEVMYSKNQILEMYLNHIPYGGTAYGIEAAAQKFFNKPANKLSLAESALLAGLPQSPTRYSPFQNPEASKARQHEVLRRMVEDGFITQTQSDQAFQEQLVYAPPSTDINAPHFVFYIKSILEDRYGIQAVEQGGLRVTTTLDLNLQNYAQASVSSELKKLEKSRVSNGAALITNPQTGEILAMIGSKDYFDTDHDGQVNLTTRLRQPGSSIKPLNYVTAFQTGRLTPASVLLDIPTCFGVPGQPPYCPKNYDGTFHGPVSIRASLASSYNIPAVKTLALNGLEDMIASVSAMGISTFTDPSRYGLSLTLGGGEVTMTDMATAFGTIDNQGVRVNLHPILKITDYTGKVYDEYHPEVTQQTLQFFFNEKNDQSNILGVTHEGLTRVLNREPAYLISHILMDNSARTPAFGASSQLQIGNKVVSVKTGTTNDLRDNWTIGYTPQYLVAAWVGNNDNTPMSPYLVSGVTGAAPIWHAIMAHLIKDIKDTTPIKPPEVDGTSICSLTGAAPTADTPCETRYEYYWKLYPPPAAVNAKKNIWINKDTGQPAFFGSDVGETTPPEQVDTSHLELQEHTVLSDPFAQDFCLDCSPPPVDPQNPDKTTYPTTTINMATFDPQAYQRQEDGQPN